MRKPAAGQTTQIERTSASRRVTIALVILLIVGAIGVGSFRLVDASSTLRAAENDIEEAAELIKDGQIARARSRLAAAEEALADVSETLHTAPEITALGIVPVLSENLASIRSSLHLASTVVHGGSLILDSAADLESEDGTLEVALEEGRVNAEQLQDARTQIDALLVDLTVGLDQPDSRFLLPPTRELRDAVVGEAEEQRENLDRLRRGLVIVDELLGISQPTRTLLSIANTAEMRGSGGMMLNYGVIDGDAGGADLGDFGRVEELPVATALDPELIGLPEDFSRRWEGFDVTREWRNTTLSGDFALTAPALLAMYERSTGVPANNVVQIDPQGLAAMLSVVGPVQVAEVGQVTADTVVPLVLNEAYALFPGVEERTDVLGDVAEATFEKLIDGQYPSLRDLATALVEAVDGRHIVMYSADPTVQSSLQFYEADGALPDPDQLDSLYLAVQNMSGNKLDYYVDTALDVRGQRVPGELGELTVTVTVTNNAPVDTTEPRYVFGPYSEDQVAGVYRSAITLYLPTGASLDAATGDPFRDQPSAQTENARPIASYWIDLPAGQSHTAELTFTLPPTERDQEYAMELVPSPRVRPTTATVDIGLGDGRRAQGDVVLDAGWSITASGPVSLAGY